MTERSIDSRMEEALAVLGEGFHGVPGVGVDIEMIERFSVPDQRLFTTGELAYCDAQETPSESRAGRWCAKEAVSKACAKYLQLTLREIEIGVEASGRPIVLLPDRATELGLAAEVSIAHAGPTAIAVAVAGFRAPSTPDNVRRT